MLTRKSSVLLCIGLLAAITIVAVAHWTVYSILRESTILQTRTLLEQHTQHVTAELENNLHELFIDLQDILAIPPDEDPTFIDLEGHLSRWAEEHSQPALSAILLITAEGVVAKVGQDPMLANEVDPAIILAHAREHRNQPGSSEVLTIGERPYLHINLPVLRGEQIAGALALLINLPELLTEHLSPGPEDANCLALIDRQGTILHTTSVEVPGDSLETLLSVKNANLLPIKRAVARGVNRSFAVDLVIPTGSRAVLLDVAPLRLPGQLWNVAYTLPLDRLATPLPTVILLAMAVIGSLAVLGLTFAMLHRRRLENDALKRNLDDLELTRRALQEDLEAHQTRSGHFLHNAGDGLFFIDLETLNLVDINRRAEEILGYSRGEIERVGHKAIIPRRYRNRFWRLVVRVRRDGLADETELQFRRKDGSLFIGSVQARVGWLGNRRVIHGSFRDITPTVNLAVELRRHNRRLSLLNEISQRVAEGRDLPSKLEIILDRVIENLGVSGGGIFLLHHQGTEMELAIHRDIPPEALAELKKMRPGDGLAGKVAATGRPRLSTNLQSDHRRVSAAVVKDGWRAFLAVPLTAEEEALGVLFIFDRSNRIINREDVRLMQAIGRQVGPLVRNAELIAELQWQQRLNEASVRELERSRLNLRDNLDKLEESHRRLESLDQMKSTFLGLASHELRTPLTTILSGAELLQTLLDEEAPPQVRRAIQVILNGSGRLNKIIDDLLEAARLEAQSLYLAREAFDPRPLIDDLLNKFGPVCEQRRIDCALENFPDESVIRGDAHHLSRALDRLMENAVKFTPEGGRIWVVGSILSQPEVIKSAERLQPFSPAFFEREHADHYLSISILDNGAGIDVSEQMRVFDKFYEVGDISRHSTSKSSYGGKGVGLGLTLAKGVIEAHDGMIWVESEGVERGSRFSILLPLAAPH